MKRFRIFAGPNGSGKSTIIKEIRQTVVKGRRIDFGVYVNADDISAFLLVNSFDFSKYTLPEVTLVQLVSFATEWGLFRNGFDEMRLGKAINIAGCKLMLVDTEWKDQVAQILSNFVINELLNAGKKCSMETVFSHESKVSYMQHANAMGYKVYLYFVATAHPDINVARVAARVAQYGHNVPEDRIRDRYNKSLNLMYDAAQEAYQAYFFDNSGEQRRHQQVAHFKIVGKKKRWDPFEAELLPDWFVKYYVNKQI